MLITLDLNNYEQIQKNNDILEIKTKSEMEKVEMMNDKLPCLLLRKNAQRIRV